MEQNHREPGVNGLVQRVLPYIVAALLAVCGWVAAETVDYGKVLSGLTSEKNAIVKEVTILRGEMKDRFGEMNDRFRDVRSDIKDLAQRMDVRK